MASERQTGQGKIRREKYTYFLYVCVREKEKKRKARRKEQHIAQRKEYQRNQIMIFSFQLRFFRLQCAPVRYLVLDASFGCRVKKKRRSKKLPIRIHIVLLIQASKNSFFFLSPNKLSHSLCTRFRSSLFLSLYHFVVLSHLHSS